MTRNSFFFGFRKIRGVVFNETGNIVNSYLRKLLSTDVHTRHQCPMDPRVSLHLRKCLRQNNIDIIKLKEGSDPLISGILILIPPLTHQSSFHILCHWPSRNCFPLQIAFPSSFLLLAQCSVGPLH